MRKIKPCFGNNKMFFKEKLEECRTCQFKRKCLLKCHGKQIDEKYDSEGSQEELELLGKGGEV